MQIPVPEMDLRICPHIPRALDTISKQKLAAASADYPLPKQRGGGEGG